MNTEYDSFIKDVVENKIPYYQDFAINYTESIYISGTAQKIVKYAIQLANYYKMNKDNYQDEKVRARIYRYEDLYRRNVRRFETALYGEIIYE